MTGVVTKNKKASHAKHIHASHLNLLVVPLGMGSSSLHCNPRSSQSFKCLTASSDRCRIVKRFLPAISFLHPCNVHDMLSPIVRFHFLTTVCYHSRDVWCETSFNLADLTPYESFHGDLESLDSSFSPRTSMIITTTKSNCMLSTKPTLVEWLSLRAIINEVHPRGWA